MNKKIIQKRTLATITLLFCLLCSLVFSKVANAITLNAQVQLDRIIIGKGDVRCVINGQTINGASQSGECSFTPAGAVGDLNVVQQIYNNQNLTLQKGDMLEFFVGVKSLRAGSSHNIVWTAQTYDYFSLVDMEKVSEDDYNRWCLSYQPSNVPSGSYTCSTNSSGYSNFYRFVIMANRDLTNVKGGLGYYTTSRSTLFVSDTIQPFIIYMSDIFIYKRGSDLDVAEQQTQEATDEGQQNSDSAGSDNEQASQNLLQTAGDIIGAFSSPSTNCSLSGDLGNIDLGNLNFCQDKPSAIINAMDAIASIIVAFMVFRIIKRLIGRFTSLSAYGQGGSDG